MRLRLLCLPFWLFVFESTAEAQAAPNNKFLQGDGSYLLAADLAGTRYYCSVDVQAALDRAITTAARGGKRFKLLAPAEKWRQEAGTRFVHLQLTATAASGSSSCSIAATLTFARQEVVTNGGVEMKRSIHSSPGTTFIEPEHTRDEASLALELTTYLMIIDQMASNEGTDFLSP